MKISIFVGCSSQNTHQQQFRDNKQENGNWSQLTSALLTQTSNNSLDQNATNKKNHYSAANNTGSSYDQYFNRNRETAPPSKHYYPYNKTQVMKPHGTIPYVKLQKKNDSRVPTPLVVPRPVSQIPATVFKPGLIQRKQLNITTTTTTTCINHNNVENSSDSHAVVASASSHITDITGNYGTTGNFLEFSEIVTPPMVMQNCNNDICYEQYNLSMLKNANPSIDVSKPTIRIYIDVKDTPSYSIHNQNGYYNESIFFWINNRILKYGWNFIQMTQELNCLVYDECNISKNIVENLLTTSIDYLPYANWKNTFFIFNSGEFSDIGIDSNIRIFNRKFRCLNLNQILPIECHFQEDVYEPVTAFKQFFSNFTFIQSTIQGELADCNQYNIFKNVTFSFQTVPGLIDYTIYYNNDVESQLPFRIPRCNLFSNTCTELNKNCSKICKHCIIFVNNGTSYIENKNSLHYQFTICRRVTFICIQK